MPVTFNHSILAARDRHASARFDEILARVRKREIPFTADPQMQRPHQVGVEEGGRRYCFLDRVGHGFGVLTLPDGL